MRRAAPLVALGALALACPARGPALHVMSFNIRYGTAQDGDDAWPLRRARTFTVIRDAAPDLLAVQEALHFQIEELRGTFPEYARIGVGRDDGDTAGEYAAILYRSDRLAVDSSGTFWLSDTPDVPGSMSWGNRITRIATWGLLRDRVAGTRFAVVNVHLDHESQPARERGVALALARIRNLAPGLPVIFTGDFNAEEANPTVAAVKVDGFVDTFRARYPDAAYAGTFSAFRGDSTGPKIDYVFVRGPWTVSDAAIVRTRPGGRDASDHFAVTAVLRPHRNSR